MKPVKKIASALTIAALLTGLAVNFTACTGQSPVSPQPDNAQKKSLNIVKLGKSGSLHSLNKKVEKKKTIKKEKGGQIVLLPGTNEELWKLVHQQPPMHSVALKRRLLHGSPLSAVILIDAIKRRKPMKSKHLQKVLLANTPLNPTVLIKAIRKNALTKKHLNKVLLANFPLRTSVLKALLKAKRLRSIDLKRLLIKSSPLKQTILHQIRSQSVGLKRSHLNKVLRAQKIKKDKIKDEYKMNLGQMGVKIKFKVMPASVTEDLEITISTDDEELAGNIFLTFGPHGTDFNPPAILDIEVSGLDLSGWSDDKNHGINIFYINEGDWEVMKSEKIIVKKNEGYLKIKGAELPHFSRYAIGAE
ncbi:hypothetical protein IH970_12360 [candidate division KSB1 bacterium]|nr:hypothetical protein [candidate division KSB1 bacterium]